VIGEDDLVAGLVIHDAVETGTDMDLPDDGQRFQIEHRDGFVSAVGREAVAESAHDPGAVDAGVLGRSPSTLPVAPSTTIMWSDRDTNTRPVADSTVT